MEGAQVTPEKKALGERTRGMADCGRGTTAGYASGCRCDACRKASVDYNRERRRMHAFGKPSKMVDAEPVHRRVAKLIEMGYSHSEISRLSGLGESTVYRLANGRSRTGKRLKRVSRHTKDAIYSIRGRRLEPEQLVDASEMARDVSRWRDSGMTVKHMAERIGCGRQVLDEVLHGRRLRVRAKTLYRFRVAKPGLEKEAGSYLPDALEVLGI